MKEFLLSDESENSHGHIVITDGIRLDRFLKNPVMFYNHDESKGVVGKWVNVRKENGKLYGTPVFDVRSDTGRLLEQQVQNGFLRGASIGIDNVEYDYNPTASGPLTIAGCELIEVSVCDIPSNRNTLQLYYNKKAVDMDTHKKLSSIRQHMTQEETARILALLGLPEDATVDDVLNEIEQIKKGTQPRNGLLLDEAIKCGYVRPGEKEHLCKSFAGNVEGLNVFLSERRKMFKKETEAEYGKLSGKYAHLFNLTKLRAIPQEELMAFIGDNIAMFRRLMECTRVARRAIDDIRPVSAGHTDRTGWTLEDYRKKDPMELRRNPALYRELIRHKKQ